MRHVIANLDVEARLAGVTLPRVALQAIADAGTLLRALLPADATEEDATLWLPAEVDPARVVDVPGLARPRLAVGRPDRLEDGDTVLAWALEDRRFHHRRLALDLGRRLGTAHPGARFVASVDALRDHLRSTAIEHWVVKAPYSAAGRDRHRGTCSPPGDLGDADIKRVQRLLRQHRELLFEPWVDRDLGDDSLDFGVLGLVRARGDVELVGAHRLRVDAEGRFQGIEVGPLSWLADEEMRARASAEAAGLALAEIGYQGPFGVDGYRFRSASQIRLQPLGEINARLTFGFIARALARLPGSTTRERRPGEFADTEPRLQLCFGSDVPPTTGPRQVVPLLAPAGSQRRAAWIER